ncbi:hypothetical protein OIO90_002631 [Microbotryomycetes sp. JL221]|nr:hypothetical protein OIO90_002631 [Microbotryomycetes sp. JL221]
MALPEAQETILRNSERDTVSAKRVRKELQTLYPHYDIKSQKDSIDGLTMDAFNSIFESSTNDEPAKPKFEPSSSNALRSPTRSASPAAHGTALSDAELARQLSMNLNGPARRVTRAGPVRNKTKSRAKSRSMVDEDDDPDSISTSKKAKPKRKATGGGFNKPHLLSEALADVCGETVLSRPAVTKHLWKYIKANNLQDPKKKTDILPDEKLKFHDGQGELLHISPHLYPYEGPTEDKLVESGDDEEDEKASQAESI